MAPPDELQCDFHAPANVNLIFKAAIASGIGNVTITSFTVDGQDCTASLTANLGNGPHRLVFVLFFSDPNATAVIQEACNPPQNLCIVTQDQSSTVLRICVP